MIYLLSFGDGIPMNLELSPEAIMPLLLKTYSTRVKVLRAGTHDLTPCQFNFRRFDYSVEVAPKGERQQ